MKNIKHLLLQLLICCCIISTEVKADTHEIHFAEKCDPYSDSYSTIAKRVGYIKYDVVAVDSADKVVFDLSQAFISGNYLDVPCFISSDDSITSMDFAFRYDLTKLTYDSLIDQTTYLLPLAYYNTSDSTLRFTSSSLSNYKINSTLVFVRFKILSTGISTSDFFAEKAYLNGKPAGIKIIGTYKVSVFELNSSSGLKIYPNPANQEVNIESKEKLNLQLFDIAGHLVIREISSSQKTILNTGSLPAGFYTLKLNAEKSSALKKIIISR